MHFHILKFCVVSLAVAVAARVPGADFNGVTEPFQDATLTAPVAGLIGRHMFVEGDRVEAGKVILELDKRLEELEVARREAVLENAATILQRTEQLAATSKAVAAEEVDKHRAEKRIAQAELDVAREQLRRRQVVAPFSGVVADLFGLDDGEGCQPQTPLVRLVDTRRCWVVANIDARVALSIHSSDRVQVQVETSAGSRVIPAEVKFVSPVADPASGLVKVKAVFDNSETGIAAGAAAVLRVPDRK